MQCSYHIYVENYLRRQELLSSLTTNPFLQLSHFPIPLVEQLVHWLGEAHANEEGNWMGKKMIYTQEDIVLQHNEQY